MSHSRKIARTMDHSHLLLARHRHFIGSRVAARRPFPTEALSKVSCFLIWQMEISLCFARNFAMAAATFMNSNSLPVALLQSLAATVPDLKWGEDDTKDAIIGRALTYLLLCSTIGQFVSKFHFSLLSCDLIKWVVDSLELWRSAALHG